MPPVGFEPTIPASERPQTYALGRAVNGTGVANYTVLSYPNVIIIIVIIVVRLQTMHGTFERKPCLERRTSSPSYCRTITSGLPLLTVRFVGLTNTNPFCRRYSFCLLCGSALFLLIL